MLTLLIKSVVFILVSSSVGASLLCYVTKLRRFSGFFITLTECSVLAVFIVTGFTAIFVRILRHLLCVTSYICPSSPDTCSLADADFLLLDSTFSLVLFFTVIVTVVQFFIVRERSVNINALLAFIICYKSKS